MGENSEELAGLALRGIRTFVGFIWFCLGFGLLAFSYWPWLLGSLPTASANGTFVAYAVAVVMDFIGVLCLLRAFAFLFRKKSAKRPFRD